MAKQTGEFKITGTIDDVTYYQMEGQYYARKKSCLKGERVKRDPRFKRTMQSARRFGRGNQLASKVYRSLPRQEQVYTLFKELKRIAILAIKEKKSEEEVMLLLKQRMVKETNIKEAGSVKAQKTQPVLFVPSFAKRLFVVSDGRRVIKVKNKRFKPCTKYYPEQRE